MRPQTCLKLLNSLLTQPVFTSKEAKALGVTASVLGYYVKVGKLKRMRRGVYQAIGYQNSESFLSAKRSRPIKIVRFLDPNLGKIEIELEGTSVPIFDRERTIVDAFRLLSRETAIKALKSAVAKGGKNRIDLVKLEAYAKKASI